MYKIWIDEEVESYFAASPVGPLLEVGRVVRKNDHPLFDRMKKSFDLVPSDAITEIFENANFCGLYGDLCQSEKEWFAKEWVIIEELNRRNSRRRRSYILDQNTESRPVPYDEPELSDLVVTTDRLVPLSGFDIKAGILIRNKQAYTILPSTPSENSSYWVTRTLLAEGLQDRAWVRLDPMIRGLAQTFPFMSYRMLWWGPPLLWKDVRDIERESFGRWVPATISHKSEFTDFAWERRGSEIHLFLEEMPKRNDIAIAGSRYFHVIFSKKTECVLHLDGAIRIYSADEWDQRRDVPVHRTGKVGKRIKVFRLDEPTPPEVVSSLGGTFFVWNYDVAHFFGATVQSSWLGNN